MKFSVVRPGAPSIILSVLLAGIGAPVSAAPIVFDGLSVYGVNAGGAAAGYSLGENSSGLLTNGGGMQNVDTAYLATGSTMPTPTFLNSAAVTSLSFSISTAGTYTFTSYLPGGLLGPARGLNLFFGGASLPEISAWATINTSSFAVESSSNTIPLNGVVPLIVPAASSLSYDNGTFTATLTAFAPVSSFTVNGTLGGHIITSLSGTTSGEAQTFTLTVTQNVADVPEPATLATLSAGLAGLLALRRRKARA